MGGTVTGQYEKVVEGFWCTRCGSRENPCYSEWDYCPAGTDNFRWAFCETCLAFMLKKLKAKKT